MDDLPPIEPDLSPEHQRELGHIAYFLAELGELQARGVIPAEASATAAAEKTARRDQIERQGRAATALKNARNLRQQGRADAALTWAAHARRLAPEQESGWSLAVDLMRQRHMFAEAIALCEEAADQQGQAAWREQAEAIRAEHLGHEEVRELKACLDQARQAAAQGRDDEAVAHCNRILERKPRQPDTLIVAASACERLGRFAEALRHLDLLRQVRPRDEALWNRRIRAIQDRMRQAPAPAAAPVSPEVAFLDDPTTVGQPASTSRRPAPAPGPAINWATVTGEFLQDHWQKLILSLAVVLIVVSSTVGAALVLGDRLWNAEGKCLLALVYTLAFAGLGKGLSAWGAERVGRIMGLTTLIVLPINFALVGELPGLGQLAAPSLAVLVLDTAALIALGWWLCRALGIASGGRTPAALMILGSLNVATPRSVPFAWGFSALLTSAVTLLAATWALNAWLARRRDRKADADTDTDLVYFALGLLGFFYLFTVARIGGFVLQLAPTLYALPVMLAAVAAVRAAEILKGIGTEVRPAALVRFAGLVVSGLAFALALARPPGPSTLLSGNTLATALVGLVLYARLLRAERHPAYLYAAFGALVLAYFGIQNFVHDLIAEWEATIGQALGYGRKLPVSFRALNGLVFTVGLAGLAQAFSRQGERRLAWHCHAIGLPLSVAACALGAFEPTAAVLTLGSYAALYAIGTWWFEVPWLAYLACAAFTGAAIAAASFLGDLTYGAQALAAAAIGLVLWGACEVLAAREISIDYRTPIVRSSRVVSAVALVLAMVALLMPHPVGWTTALAFGFLAVLYGLIGLESPRPTVAHAAVACGAVAALLSFRVGVARLGWTVSEAWFAAWAAAVSALLCGASPGVRGLAERRAVWLGRPSRFGPYPAPLLRLGLVLAAIGAGVTAWLVVERSAGLTVSEWAGIALALGLVAVALITATLDLRSEPLAYPATWAGSAAALAGALAGCGLWGLGPTSALLAVLCGGLALLLTGMGEGTDRSSQAGPGWAALFRRPLFVSTLLAVAWAWGCSVLAWGDFPARATALTLTALALAGSNRRAPGRALPLLAMASGLAAWLCGFEALHGGALRSWPDYGVVVGTYAALVLALGELARGVWTARLDTGDPGRPAAARAFVSVIPEFVLVATVATLALALPGLASGPLATPTAGLAVGAVELLWLVRFRREPGLMAVGLFVGWMAILSGCAWIVGRPGPDLSLGVFLGWMALASAGVVLALILLRLVGKWVGLGPLFDRPACGVALLATASVFGLVGVARVETFAAYPTSVSALGVLAVALVLAAVLDRLAGWTYAAAGAVVAVSYLTLFELGRGRPGSVSALGVLATLDAIGFWTIGLVCRRRLGAVWQAVFTRPLTIVALILAVLALPPDWGAPWGLALAALPFVLMIESFPAAEWLYAALAVLAASAAFATLQSYGPGALPAAAVGMAFGCWGLGLVLRRFGPGLSARLGLPDREYGGPPFQVVLVLGGIALGLRFDAVARLGQAWWAGPWLPWALAVLALLMLKPYPRRGWVDGFVGLVTFGFASLLASWFKSPLLAIPAGLGLALFWLAVCWGLARIEQPVCRRLGIAFNASALVVEQWSLGLFAVSLLPAAALVVGSTLASALHLPPLPLPIAPADWWGTLLSLALGWLYVALKGGNAQDDRVFTSLHIALTAALWWLGVPSSPLVRAGWLDPALYDPLATATASLVSILTGLGWLARADGPSRRARFAGWFGVGLALVAVVFTRGVVGATTTATFLMTTAALTLATIALRRVGLAYLAAAAWCFGCLYAGWDGARRLGGIDPSVETLALASGLAVSAATLVALGGWLRRGAGDFALEVESVGLFAALVAAVGVAVGLAGGTEVGGLALMGLGVLWVVGAVSTVLALRWEAELLIYMAQAALIGSYAAYRAGFPSPGVGDSVVVFLLGALNLGLAEVLQRLQRPLFARPALMVALLLPLVALGLAVRQGIVSEETLFLLAAAGTFYAVICGRTGWKGSGYAAAVLYNAFLWVIWARVGWRLSDAPQYYLVPVGLSTILFAEVNRRELGRSNVQAIRGVGLILIYLALAVPIWRFESLSAWAGLLVASLAAIFAGIGLRAQTFLWFGLAGFLLAMSYQIGRIGLEHALARWAIMLALGLALVLFVALNEKKQLVHSLRAFYDQVRRWD